MPLTIPQIIFILYLFIVLGIGIYAAKFTKYTPSDFYVAGRGVGSIILGLTFMATILSAFTFLGLGAVSVGTGVGLMAMMGMASVFYALAFSTVGVSFAKLGRERDILTPTEYLRKRYDSAYLGTFYLLVVGIFMVGMIAGQLIGGGVALGALADIPYNWAIIGMGVFMIVYMHIAGYRGVIWSDALQSLVLFGILAAVFIWLLLTISGDTLVSGALDANPEIFTREGPLGVWTILFLVTNTIVFVLGVAGYPHVIQRYFSASNLRVMRRAGIVYAGLAIPAFFFAVALGIWSLGIIPTPEDPDFVIPLLIEEVTNPVVFGIAMAGATAAIMSTSDSVALTLSSMFSRDVYREFFEREMTENREVRITQVLLIVVIGFSVLMAWVRPGGIFAVIELAVAGFAVTTPPVIIGLYWKRATKEAAYISLLLGGAAVLLMFFEVIPVEFRFGMHYGFVGILLAYVSFIVISLVTSRPDDEVLEKYIL